MPLSNTMAWNYLTDNTGWYLPGQAAVNLNPEPRLMGAAANMMQPNVLLTPSLEDAARRLINAQADAVTIQNSPFMYFDTGLGQTAHITEHTNYLGQAARRTVETTAASVFSGYMTETPPKKKEPLTFNERMKERIRT